MERIDAENSGTADAASVRPAEPTTAAQRDRRARIVRAAMDLLADHGYDEIQMRDVAVGAGVALGTLYRYFPSKMDLLVAVVADELDVLETSIERRPPTARTPARRAVDLLIRATRGLMREPELADALVRSLIRSDVETDFAERVTRMLLRVATPGADAAGTRETALAGALTSVWVMELLDVLKGHATIEQIQPRLEVAAGRLLEDF